MALLRRNWPLQNLAALALLVGLGMPQMARAKLTPGETLPAFTLPNLGGDAVTIVPTRARILVIEFWASWCAPCREVLPALARLANHYPSPRLEVIAVNIDRESATATHFLDVHLPQRGITLLRDPDNVTMTAWGAPGMPSIYVVIDGIVRLVESGYSPEKLQSIEDLVRQMLRE
jgi:thiol-disulfide isomerase/thioredoxin